MSLYERLDDLCAQVVELAQSSRDLGESLLIVARPAHRTAIVAALDARGVDWRGLRAVGRWFVLDADGTLARFMVNGRPDPVRFAAVVGESVTIASWNGSVPLRIFGEMVDVLWSRGQSAAALELEELWNRLAERHAFSLLCGYATASVRGTAGLAAVHAEHSHVLSVLGPPQIADW